MQLIIDIPEEVYKTIKKYGYIYEGSIEDIALSIIGGTPLPKEHGNLIDREELLRMPLNMANYPSNYVHMAQVIVKAYKPEGGTKCN